MERCMFCGQIAEMVYVHGHYQCSRCHQVTVPCCNGEMAQATDRTTERQPAFGPKRSSTTR